MTRKARGRAPFVVQARGTRWSSSLHWPDPASAWLSAPIGRRAYWVVGLLVVAAAGVDAWLGRAGVLFPLDDAYITLHSAMALRSGVDPSFGGVDGLVGATSGLHVALVAAMLSLVPPLWALWLVNWLAALAYAMGLVRLVRGFAAPRWQAVALLLAGLVGARVPNQVLNGLETGLALAGVAWVLALSRERGKVASAALPMLCSQLPFVRPELIVFSVFILVARAFDDRASGPGQGSAFRRLAWSLVAMAVGAVPWLAFQFAHTGALYPSTIAAKTFFFAEGCRGAARAASSSSARWVPLPGARC